VVDSQSGFINPILTKGSVERTWCPFSEAKTPLDIRRVVLRVLAWASILAGTGWIGLRHSAIVNQAAESDFVVHSNLRYLDRGGPGTTLDLYLPKRHDHFGATRFPAVLLLHAGSWQGGSKSDYRLDPRRNALRLTHWGIAVLAVDYRLGRPGAPSWPGVLEDLREAVRWTRRHADQFQLDPNRIAVIGQSAGATLAMRLGIDERVPVEEGASSKVQAVISFYGASDLGLLVKKRNTPNDSVFRLLGEPTSTGFVKRERDASPLTMIGSSAAPMLLIHGDSDLWVPIEQSRMMSRALDRAGIRNRLITVEGARHGFETIVEAPRRIDLLPEILGFLNEVWRETPNGSGDSRETRKSP
jgi:acetyl esterase/lipase